MKDVCVLVTLIIFYKKNFIRTKALILEKN